MTDSRMVWPANPESSGGVRHFDGEPVFPPPAVPSAQALPSEAAVLRLLDEALSELTNEENKAGRITAAFTVATGALVTGFLAGRWSPAGLSAVGALIWWCGALCVLGALALAGAAALTVGYRSWHEPALPRDPAAVWRWAAAVVTAPGEDAASRLMRIRRRISRKRRLLTWGLVTMAAGLMLCLLGGLASR
ncbi:hypothetical protein [Catenuloplanes indicus]|uniref:Pycsar effector protein domain-containing protein n=1 Tax=Catenuloplanes indicus TaxID=137267 RepID=A0AAE3VXX9_9ACTN|nr:hypothetical protein [Catenuloplanes indicus]MDQ0365035.1 hypothetical protein [Catenuloplanes indicus]